MNDFIVHHIANNNKGRGNKSFQNVWALYLHPNRNRDLREISNIVHSRPFATAVRIWKNPFGGRKTKRKTHTVDSIDSVQVKSFYLSAMVLKHVLCEWLSHDHHETKLLPAFIITA